MNKYLTKQFAKKIIIAGSIIFLVGLVLLIAGSNSLYSLVGKCPASASNCQGVTWQNGVFRAAGYLLAIGFYVVLMGVIDLVIAAARKK